jgi:uncharacterized membrane protein
VEVLAVERDILFLGLVILTAVLLVSTLVYTIVLGVQVREAGIGRIVFASLATLKGWVLLIFAYFLIGVFFPVVLEGTARREVVRFGLVLYVLVQALATLIALERWRKRDE